MPLAHAYKLSLYGLAVLVAGVLGAAESGSWVPYGMLPAAIFGYWWCEMSHGPIGKQSTGLPDTLAAACGLVALLASANEFYSDKYEGKILSGVHLLVYLGWIVLLQQKTIRRCWLLMALGVIQMAIASVLTSQGWFGMALLIYMFAAIWTLSVFSLYQSDMTLKTEHSPDLKLAMAADADNRRSKSIGAVCHAEGGGWFSRRFVIGTALTYLSSLFVSGLFFLLIPRVWIGAPLEISAEGISGQIRQSVSGFSRGVQLGNAGLAWESLEPVFDIRLKSLQTDELISPYTYAEQLGHAEPLFRGSISVNYHQRRWDPVVPQGTTVLRSRQNTTLEIQQEINLKATRSDILFFMGQPASLFVIDGDRTKPIGEYVQATGLVQRGPVANSPQESSRQGLQYLVWSSLPVPDESGLIGLEATAYDFSNTRATARPAREASRGVPSNVAWRNQPVRQMYLNIHEGLDGLRELAESVISEAQSRQNRNLSDLEKARTLEAYLQRSGQYKYSLKSSIINSQIDPVEDFLINRKAGHCEYFASALTLMMRSQNIPARLVTGFKGGELLSDGTLQVQQRFAHAWVEALIDRRVWVTFDGTPASQRTVLVESFARRSRVWTDTNAALSNMWSNNVINISLDRQQEMIYTPLQDLAAKIWEAILRMWASPAESLSQLLWLLIDITKGVSVGAGGFGLLLLATGFYLFRRRRDWSLWGALNASQQQIPPRPRVLFYERFTGLMESRGLHRDFTQTQQEFAGHASEQLMSCLEPVHLKDVPTSITTFFYRVRFGSENLSEVELTEIEDHLGRLEQSLSPNDQQQSALNGQ